MGLIMKKLVAVIFFLSLLIVNNSMIYAQDCSGTLPSQLGMNMGSSVNEGNSLNLRTSPETGDIIGTLSAGEEFKIISTSVCGSQNGLRWWQIDWNGTVGWIAEGDLDEHWIAQPALPMFVIFANDDGEEIVPTAIPPTQAPSTGVIFNDLQVVEEDDGIRFWVDVSITNYANQELNLYLWLVDVASNEYLRNSDAHENYTNSSDTLYLEYNIKPCCESVTYGIGDIHMFIPYDQLPAGDYTFYPQITVYDENIEYIDERSFWDLEISNRPPATGSASFHRVEHQYVAEGMWFTVDMTVRDRAGQDLMVYLWFVDEATGEFIRNPIASEDHRNSSNSLLTSVEIQPTSNNETYNDTDVALYIPYHEFPRGSYNYSLFVGLYDAELNEITQDQFNDPIINSGDHPFPESNILVRDISYTFEDAGVRYYVDMDVNGFAGQELDVYAFFRTYSEEYIQSALQMDNYYQTDLGSIIAFNTITPCCEGVQSYTGDSKIELYVPYNVFPHGTYSYFPVIGVSYAGEQDQIKTRFFRDKTIEVLGDEQPAGYIVNYKIEQLDGVRPSNFGGMANSGPEWDDLLLTYSLYEIDRNGTTIPGEQNYWTGYIWRNSTHTEGFETILLDIPADSYLMVRSEFMEVVDMDATEDAVDALRDVGKAARKGARFLPRVFRVAAKSAGRYVNGMLLWYDIIAFFEKDRLLGVYERSISPDELYQMYLQTGARGETWLVDHATAGGEQGDYYQYDMTLEYWLYGYARHAESVD
jgi:hypothetical protein